MPTVNTRAAKLQPALRPTLPDSGTMSPGFGGGDGNLAALIAQLRSRLQRGDTGMATARGGLSPALAPGLQAPGAGAGQQMTATVTPAGGPPRPTVSPLGPQVQPLPSAPGAQGAPPPGVAAGPEGPSASPLGPRAGAPPAAWLETLSAPSMTGLRPMTGGGLMAPSGGGIDPWGGGDPVRTMQPAPRPELEQLLRRRQATNARHGDLVRRYAV